MAGQDSAVGSRDGALKASPATSTSAGQKRAREDDGTNLLSATNAPTGQKRARAAIDGLSGLQSSKTNDNLEKIANLRALGIGDHIDLPQLVVCGDQSAGKSSVLEGITGIPFPRQDGVCTKFATEIILQHSTDDSVITATILPHDSRTEQQKASLKKFKSTLKSISDLPDVISEAGALMELRGFNGRALWPAFGRDVLRIHVAGPTQPHLSIVDLPGLIENPSDEQTYEDCDTVHRLADSYLKNPRTIILAVVQAGNDIANQPIIRKSRSRDASGNRTVGIITKPDLINEGTEVRIARLAKNQDSTKLKLGFFLVKNPAPKALGEGVTVEQRLKDEDKFFASSPWREQGLDPTRTGIQSLKVYLQGLFAHHIKQQLPKVREEIQTLLERTGRAINDLGEPRVKAADCRTYLLRLSTGFNRLCSSALNGTYQEADAVFFDTDDQENSTRLRAEVHKRNTEFSDHIHIFGQQRKVVSKPKAGSNRDDEAAHAASKFGPNSQIEVTSDDMKLWVKKIYRNSRGKELPGTYNHVLLSELFRQQSRPWKRIAEEHIESLSSFAESFVSKSLKHLINDEYILSETLEITNEALRKRKVAADQEFERLLEDESDQPITYNHYFTDTVQNSRITAVEKVIDKAKPADKMPVNPFDVARSSADIVTTLKKNLEVNMELQACSEASAALKAYYKVALKTFVDNVCRQVIERHLLRNLSDIFSPETVSRMEEDELMRIAGELPNSAMKRKELMDLRLQLTESLRDLRK